MTELPPSAEPKIYGPALSWWLRATKELGRLPSRSHFEPSDIGAQALPYVIIVDIIGLAEDMRFRLLGTVHDNFNGRNLTGQLFSDVYPPGSPILTYVRGLYVEMINARRPLWSLNVFGRVAGSEQVRMGRLMMPLSTDGGAVDMAVVVQKIDYPEFPGESVRNSWMRGTSPSETERMLH